MVPHKLLVWVEVDLDTDEVVNVRCCDYVENYESWPASGDEVEDEDESLVYARGLINLSDNWPDGHDPDVATDEETIQAGRVLADPDKPWPTLRIEDVAR